MPIVLLNHVLGENQFVNLVNSVNIRGRHFIQVGVALFLALLRDGFISLLVKQVF